MKLLVVAQREDLKNLVVYHLNPLGFEIVFYSDPVKVIDNLDEIAPEMVIFNAQDFPRHWKPVLKLLRERRSKEQSVFVILVKDPPFEEAAKASHLGINGIIDAGLSEKQQMHQLEQLYRRYRSMKDKRRFHRVIPSEIDSLTLIFSHPRTLALVTGSLVEISIRGASFRPYDPSLTADLKRDDLIPTCTLRAGDQLLNISARVTRNKEEIGLQFRSFETGGHHKLFEYIQSRSQRELKTALAAAPREED